MPDQEADALPPRIEQQNGPKLSESAKTLIRQYMLKLIIPSGIALSIFSAIIGFLINEVARGEAYETAYGQATRNILDIASQVSNAVGTVDTLRDETKKYHDQSEQALSSILNRKLQIDQILRNDVNAIASTLAKTPQFRENLANVQNEQLAKLNNEISTLQSTVLAIQSSSSHTAIRGTDPSVAGGLGPVGGLSGTYSLDNDRFVSCPAGSFVSAIQGFTSGGRAIVQIRYACRSIK